MEKRYNGKCPGCKKPHSLLATARKKRVLVSPGDWRVEFEIGSGEVLLSASHNESLILAKSLCCSRGMYLKPVLGKVVVDKKCNSACLGATGHVCECSCGGKNHGASHG